MALQPFAQVGEVESSEVHTLLLIDMNQYSGDFDRQMCAFVTGRTGGCGVGEEIAARVLASVAGALDWTEEAMLRQADEYGIYRPVGITQTPGCVQDYNGQGYPEGEVPADVKIVQWSYQSVAISFQRVLSDEELQQLMRRAELFPSDESYLEWNSDEPLVILGYRVIEAVTTRVYKAAYTVSGAVDGA